MESGWERVESIRDLSLAEISRLIEPTSLKIRFASLIEEGKANTNYHVVTEDGQDVVLRIHTREPEAALLEQAVTDFLAGQIPLAHVLFHSIENNFSLLQWKPGATMERLLTDGRAAEVRSAAFDLGVALARMSEHIFPEPGFLQPSLQIAEAWPSTVEGLFGYTEWLTHQERVIQRAGPEMAEAVRALSQRMRPRMEDAAGPPCLVHGDFKASNLLIHEGRLSAVLDWEFAHSGTYLMSFGQIFRHEASLPEGFENDFVAGFESMAHPLPEDWKKLAHTVDLLSMMDFLNRPATGETMTKGIVSIIESTLGLSY